MVKVKSEAQIKKNYESSASLVPDRFEAGVRTADWKQSSLDGQDLYETQMQNIDILRRRSAGIEKVSDEAWRTSTITKGKGIIASRMRAASDKQVRGFAPYRAALEAVTLPPKTADPMTNLTQRAGAVVQALVDKKRELSS